MRGRPPHQSRCGSREESLVCTSGFAPAVCLTAWMTASDLRAFCCCASSARVLCVTTERTMTAVSGGTFESDSPVTSRRVRSGSFCFSEQAAAHARAAAVRSRGARRRTCRIFSPRAVRVRGSVIDVELPDGRARDDEQLVLVREGEPRRGALHVDDLEVAAVRVENLHAFEVGDVDATLVVHGDGAGRAAQTRLLAVAPH